MPFFTVTWTIENFSLCRAFEVGEKLVSPSFTLPELGDSEWYIVLFPSGDTHSGLNWVSIYIERYDRDQGSGETVFRAKITIVNVNSLSHSESKTDTCVMPPNSSLGYSKFISHKKLYDPDGGFLPHETLTIRLCITPVSDDNETLATPDTKYILFSNTLHPTHAVEECFTKDSEAEGMRLYRLSFYTYIPFEKKTLIWTLKELSAKRKSKEKMTVILDSEFADGVNLHLVCYVDGSSEENEGLRMDISRRGTDRSDLSRTFIKCKISFLNGSDVVLGSKQSEHVFRKTYKRWSFSLIDKLGSSKYLINDSIKIICDFVIAYEPENSGGTEKYSPAPKHKKLKDEIKEMLDHEEILNFSFECKNEQKFPVHRFLICARSPVFRAMLSSDTLEKQTGVVRMRDTDTTTVQHLREYLYSDYLPDLETEDMLKLYSVADKYQIEKLKDKCATFLKCSMTLDNVCDILTKADIHQDAGLKDYATDFVIAEMDFNSDLWKTFMDENLPLAAETMRKFCVKKRNSKI